MDRSEERREERKSMKFLVTGGLGFIGSHTVELLSKWYWEAPIVVLDVITYAVLPSTRKLIEAIPLVEIVEADLTDTKAMQDLLSKHRFTHILHFAAESHVGNSFGKNSLTFTQTNVFGTHSLLEAWRLSPHRKALKIFVHVSTDEVHGSIAAKSAKEEDGTKTVKETILMPTNPYAASKAAAEMQIFAYKISYGLPAVITRGNNVFGPRQHQEKLIPRTMLRFLRGKSAEIHGSGKQKRSFLYVGNVAHAFVCIVAYYEVALREEILLIGSSFERSVMDVVRDCADATQVRKPLIQTVKDPRPFNDQRYVSGMSFVFKEWHYRSAYKHIPWEDGMKKTAEWYRKHIDIFGADD